MSIKSFFDELKKARYAPIKGHVTQDTHPELYKRIGELCEKAQISPPSNIVIIEEAFGLPNAMMGQKRSLFLGETLLKTMGYDQKQATPVITKELEAIIGHELGHSTRFSKDITMLYGSKIGAPIALYAGYKLYEYAKHRKEAKGQGSLNQHIDILTKEAEEHINKTTDQTLPEKKKSEPHRLKKHSLSLIKNIAEYFAANIASIPIVKLAGRNIEFAADSFGAKLVGKEHMANALHKLEQKTLECISDGSIPKSFYNAICLFDYHPSMASRIARL